MTHDWPALLFLVLMTLLWINISLLLVDFWSSRKLVFILVYGVLSALPLTLRLNPFFPFFPFHSFKDVFLLLLWAQYLPRNLQNVTNSQGKLTSSQCRGHSYTIILQLRLDCQIGGFTEVPHEFLISISPPPFCRSFDLPNIASSNTSVAGEEDAIEINEADEWQK